MGNATKEEANMYLGQVPIENIFHVYEGPTCINLHELVEVLKDMPEWQFGHHVNKDRNDFVNWIRDCIRDKALVKGLVRVKKKDTMIKKLRSRVEELERLK